MPPFYYYSQGCWACSRTDQQATVITHPRATVYPQFFKHSFKISKTSTIPVYSISAMVLHSFNPSLRKNFQETRTYFFHLSLANITPRKFVEFKQKLSQERFWPFGHGDRRGGGGGGNDTANWHSDESVNYVEIGRSRNGRAPRRCYVTPTAEQRAGNLWHR